MTFANRLMLYITVSATSSVPPGPHWAVTSIGAALAFPAVRGEGRAMRKEQKSKKSVLWRSVETSEAGIHYCDEKSVGVKRIHLLQAAPAESIRRCGWLDQWCFPILARGRIGLSGRVCCGWPVGRLLVLSVFVALACDCWRAECSRSRPRHRRPARSPHRSVVCASAADLVLPVTPAPHRHHAVTD